MDKTVSKKRSKTKSGLSAFLLSLITIATLAVGVLSFVSFSVKGTVRDYNAVIQKINLSSDLNGSAYAVFEPSSSTENSAELPTLVNQSVKLIEKRLKLRGFSQSQVTKLSDNRIKIEIPISDKSEAVLSSLSTKGIIEFKAEEGGDVLLTGDAVKSAKAGYTVNSAQTAYVPVVVLKFDSDGAKEFTKATETALAGSKKILITLDGETVSTITVSEVIKSKEVTIQNESWSADSAQDLANIFSSGNLPLEFERLEFAMVSTSLGVKAITKTLIGGAIAVFVAIVVLIVLYKGLGLVAAYSTVIYVLSTFLFLTFGKVELSLSGLAAIFVGFIIQLALLVHILDRIKSEAQVGKMPESAIKYALNKTVKTVLDIVFVIALASLAMFLIGPAMLKSFALVLIISMVITCIVTLLVTRWLMKLFVSISSNKEKFFGLAREDA